MIQSNIMKAEPKKCEDAAKYSITGGIKIQKKQKKKICINRHIIKYYVITEHVLVHGAAMILEKWGMFFFLRSEPCSVDPADLW